MIKWKSELKTKFTIQTWENVSYVHNVKMICTVNLLWPSVQSTRLFKDNSTLNMFQDIPPSVIYPIIATYSRKLPQTDTCTTIIIPFIHRVQTFFVSFVFSMLLYVSPSAINILASFGLRNKKLWYVSVMCGVSHKSFKKKTILEILR